LILFYFQIDDIDERGKQVVVAFDEMQIKSKLVYQRGTGKLVGFTELGDVNDEFQRFQSSFADGKDITRDCATHTLVYMVRGIFSSLIYPFGFFATTGVTSSQLYACTMEAIRVLSALDFQVRALVSDGASTNRRLYSTIANTESDFWTLNPQSPKLRLYFFSDVPHLLKTTRNGIENSK